MKLRFDRVEEGQKRLRIAFIDSDGRPVMPPLEATVDIQFRGQEGTAAASLALNIHQLRLPRFEEYRIDLTVDDRQEASSPLYVSPVN